MRKKFYLIGFFVCFVLSSCFNNNYPVNNNKNNLTYFQIEAIKYITNEIYDYYHEYEFINYTEFKNLSVFEYESNETGLIFFGQAKTKRFLGYDTFTTIYTDGYLSQPYTSIMTAGGKEKGYAKALELYNQYKSTSGLITYIDREAANYLLQTTLNRLFPSGMDGYEEETNIFDDEYEGGDESLLTKDFEYEIINGEAAITKWIGKDDDYVRIPSKINGYTVTRIKEGAFESYDTDRTYDTIGQLSTFRRVGEHMETVYLPDTIKYIERNAFQHFKYKLAQECGNCILDYIYLPKNIEYVDPEAFDYSTKLFFRGYNPNLNGWHCVQYNFINERDLLFQNGLIYKKFSDGPLGPEAIVIDCLFSTKEVELPLVVTINNELMRVSRFGDYAFSACTELEKMTLQDTLIDINYLAFDTWSITSIVDNYPNFKFNVYGNGLYIPTQTNPHFMFFKQINSDKKVILNDNTKTICQPEYISKESFVAYDNEEYLPSESNPYFLAKTPKNEEYGERQEMTFNSQTRIVYISETRGVSHFVIPKEVIYIAYPSNGDAHFVVDKNNEIYSSDSYGSLFGNYGSTLECAGSPHDLSEKTYTIPSKVWFVADYAFSRTGYDKIVFSDNVHHVGRCAVYCVSSKFSIHIGKNISDLVWLSDGFYSYKIIDITISPENKHFTIRDNYLTSKDGKILYYLFGQSNERIHIIDSSIEFIERNAFVSGIQGTYAYIIPKSVLSVGYSDNYYIKLYCSPEKKYYLYEGSGVYYCDFECINNSIYVVENNEAKLVQCFSEEETFKMADTVKNGIKVTRIGYESLYWCQSKNIIFGENVVEIEERAFYYSKFENLTIPKGVKEIGRYAFAAALKLKWVIIPSSVSTIGENAFSGCPNDCSIFLEMEAIPVSWSNTWNSDHTYYYHSQWHYENNTPNHND